MKRLLQSLAGGVVITCLLILSLATVLTLSSEEVWNAFAYLLRWPSIFLGHYFPPEYSDDPSDPFIRGVLTVVVLMCDVLLYSAFTYMILRWRDKRLRLP